MKLVTEAHRRRVDAILIRRTDRLPFAAPTEWESFEPLLRLAFDTDAVRLDVMSDDVREELEEMSKLTTSLRLYDSAYNFELDWWTALFEFSEGIPYSALVSADEVKRVDFGRTFLSRVTGSGAPRYPVTTRRFSRCLPRGFPEGRVDMRSGAVCRPAGVHDDGLGHLHRDPHYRAADDP